MAEYEDWKGEMTEPIVPCFGIGRYLTVVKRKGEMKYLICSLFMSVLALTIGVCFQATDIKTLQDHVDIIAHKYQELQYQVDVISERIR